ncbi:MAG: CoA-binding protein, partial [Nitrospirae bacterium]
MLDALFNPRSVAVVGASHNPSKVGYSIVNNLFRFNFKGKVIPVNPKGGEILGLKVARSLTEISPPPDMVVVSIPAKLSLQTIRECEQMGVKVCVVISAGFKEVGGDGAKLEEELKKIARRGRTRILGPNCLGVINTSNSMNATFANLMLPPGRIAFFSQSGALGVAVLDWAISNRIGFSKFISLGNKADLNETDFIEYLMDDPETDV